MAAAGPEPAVGERLRTAPDVPGVYLMRGADGVAIYVGKAGSLRARLRSYIDPARQGPKTVLLMSQAAAVEWFETDTEVEALILEDTLIKQHLPRFNIRQRDDKTYPFLRLSVQEEFPALTIVRRAARDSAPSGSSGRGGRVGDVGRAGGGRAGAGAAAWCASPRR